MIFYFAYGSNLHPVRLIERVPSATLVGKAKHHHHRLSFHKRSDDGSGKCDLFRTGIESDTVYGAIYRLDPEHKNALDRFEGAGLGYIDQPIQVQHQGTEYVCFTYLAQPSHIADDLRPYHWYKQLVLLGARYLEFPAPYIASIAAVESVEDPDSARRKQRETLIGRMIRHA